MDWLAEAGQSVWQVLPLGPPDRYGSPYRSRSAFAAWPGFLAALATLVLAGGLAGLLLRRWRPEGARQREPDPRRLVFALATGFA